MACKLKVWQDADIVYIAAFVQVKKNLCEGLKQRKQRWSAHVDHLCQLILLQAI